ncbi:MAG: hypothetical protein WA705_04660 [Candidatus Ozemobacteraceae bacterium]
MSQLKTTLSYYWNQIHGFLFPLIEDEVGQLSDKLIVPVAGQCVVRLYVATGGWRNRRDLEAGEQSGPFRRRRRGVSNGCERSLPTIHSRRLGSTACLTLSVDRRIRGWT